MTTKNNTSLTPTHLVSMIRCFCRVKALHCLAAAFACLAASQSALAATVYWTGEKNNYWNESDNWTGLDSSRPLPTNDDMIFNSSSFNERFTENVVVFDGAYANAYRSYIDNVGTTEAPLVFRATDAEYGLRFSETKDTYLATSADAYLCIDNGKWSSKGTSLILGAKDNSKCELTLVNGAVFNVGWSLYSENAGNRLTVGNGAKISLDRYFCLKAGEVKVENGTIEVNKGFAFQIGENSNASLLLNEGGLLITKNIAKKAYGGTVLFNGGTLRSNNGTDSLIDRDNNLTVTVGASGGTIDNNGKNIKINADLKGSGDMTLIGNGTTTIGGSQTGTGALNVNSGTVAVNGGVSVARPTKVANGATLTVNGTAEATVDTLTLELGSKLNIASSAFPLSVAALTLPDSGKVTLTHNGGAFSAGIYKILKMTGITTSYAEKFDLSTGGETYNFTVSENTLVVECRLSSPWPMEGVCRKWQLRRPRQLGRWSIAGCGRYPRLQRRDGEYDNQLRYREWSDVPDACPWD